MFKIPNCSEKAACCHFQPLFVGRPPTVSRKPQTTSHSSHARTVRTTKSTVQMSNESVPTNYWHSISETRKKPKERYQSKSKKKHQKNAPPKKNIGVKSWNAQLFQRFLLNLRRNSDSCCVIFVFNSEISKLRGSSRAKTSGSSQKAPKRGGQPNEVQFFPTFIGI